MARAKYKLGNLVKTENQTGEITGITTRKDGYVYELDNVTTVNESDVIQAYRPVPTRTVNKSAKKPATKKNKTAPQAEAAAEH